MAMVSTDPSLTPLSQTRLTDDRIFIIEGAVTCGVALISPFILVDWPNQCRAFTPDERARIQRWASQDTGAYRMDTLDRHSLKRVICDWKIYLG